MRMRRYIQWRTLIVPLIVVLAFVVAACDTLDTDDDVAVDDPPEDEPTEDVEERDGPTVTVASFNFPESVLLAEIYAQALEAQGYPVARQLDLGARELIFPSLQDGELDLLPEYVGSALSTGFGEEASSDLDDTLEQLRAEFAAYDVTVLTPAPGENTNTFTVMPDFAEEHGLTAISDLADLGRPVVMGGPPECEGRMTCLEGLRQVYGLDVEFEVIAEVAPRVAELEAGNIDTALMWTTMPIIAETGQIMLEDDEGMFPVENIVPVVADAIVDAYGDAIVTLLDSITERITTEVLMDLNTEIEVDARDPRDVATDWLEAEGFLD